MDYQLQNEQVQSLFEESNQQNIYFQEFQFSECLQTKKPSQLDREESIRIMMGLINAILYLKTNKLNPCQIKFRYVGCDKEKNWGLKHAICYRTIDPPKSQDAYDNAEYLYHSSQDNELVWSLGKIWFRFYNEKKMTPIDTTQTFMNQLIQNSIHDKKICKVLKRMLSVKKQQRISFEQLIEDDIFSLQNAQQNLYSSICVHFQTVSKNQKVKNSLNNKRQITTPYEEQIFRRDMSEALQICYLLEKCTSLIRSLYEKSVDIEFSIYVIKAEAYCILKKLDDKKTFNQIVDNTVCQKRQYSKFVTKMLTLKQQVQRKMKMKIFWQKGGLNQQQRKFLVSTQQMSLSKIHGLFKNIVVEYYMGSVKQIQQVQAKNLTPEIRNKHIGAIQKRCLIFLLSRLCNQIFSELRSYIYEEFLKRIDKPLKILNIRQLLDFIQNCKDPVPLKLIRHKVYTNGLQGMNSYKNFSLNNK